MNDKVTISLFELASKYLFISLGIICGNHKGNSYKQTIVASEDSSLATTTNGEHEDE